MIDHLSFFQQLSSKWKWMRADWNAQNQTEVAESTPGNSCITDSAKGFPISLLIISWSFTKEAEQITLRLYLQAFLIHLGHLQGNTNSLIKELKELDFISSTKKYLFQEFWNVYCTYYIEMLDFLLYLPQSVSKASLL